MPNGIILYIPLHYLHHDKNGIKYNNQAEMSQRLMSAAQTAGIKITLIPIFYQNGGFGKKSEKEFIMCNFQNLDIKNQEGGSLICDGA